MKCPICGSHAVQTERRPNGNSRCQKCGHEAPTKEFPNKPDANTKPRIKAMPMNFEFTKDPFADLKSERAADTSQQYLTSIDLSVEVKLENVKLEGQHKYDIVKDIKDAFDKVKEKWS